MGLVLDASAALAWLIERSNPAEARQASELLHFLRGDEAMVPSLWYPEITNGILVAERHGKCPPAKTALYLSTLEELTIAEDDKEPASVQVSTLALARAYGLTGCDATYLELVLRTGRTLATFDRQLADAVRKAGGRVFGDPA
jgi:predicted nucleic acid-binding protein